MVEGVTAFVLSPSRLSGAFRERVEQLAGDPVEVLLLPELRRLGARELMRRLRSLEGHCILAVQDPSAEVLLPVLEGLAALTRARSIEIVRGDLSRRSASRAGGLAALAGLALSSVEGRWALQAARREIGGLLRTPRAVAHVDGTRVLYLNANLWLGLRSGGSVTHVAGVVNALAGLDYDVTLATAVAPSGVTGTAEVVRLEPPRRLALPVESNYYRFGRAVPEQLRDVARPSLVYQRHSLGSYAGAVLARRLGVPLVLEYNGPEVWAARNWSRPLSDERLALDAEDASLRHAALVVTVSEVLADELGARGVGADRVVWHANGVDADRFDPVRFACGERDALRARYGIPADALVVTFVGTFGQWHGVEVLARAIRRLAQGRAGGVEEARLRFLLVGDGLTMPEVREELAGLDDLVTLAGLVPQEEIPLHLAASDVLVSPHVPNADGSPFFGSPTKLFEYMASGRAIVASDLGQIGDVLRDGLALLVRPGDVEDLARGIHELAENAALRRDLGVRARAAVLERYTWRHHVRAVLDALD